jgi:ABC-type transport system involved in multi-copper enzyme maturation permease subunit
VTSVRLIALNLLRENRWTVVALVLYALAFAPVMASDNGRSSENLEAYFQMLSGYLVFFAAFLADYASFNERKTRRILSVLSKGVTRGQYIAGLLCGIFLASGLQVLGLALGGSWIASRLSLPLVPLWIAAALLWIACCLAATVATFFSAFLHPLLAMVCASIVISLPIIASHFANAGAAIAMPVYSLVLSASQRIGGAASPAFMPQILIAVIEGIIFALLAARVFQKRDIALAIE